MIIAAAVVGGVLTWILLGSSRQLARRGLKRTARYHLVSNSLEFLVPFTGVACLYLLIWIVVVLAPGFATVGSLMDFEAFLGRVRSAAAVFKLSAVQAFVVLFALFALALLIARIQSVGGLFKAFDKYRLITRRVYTVAVLLCSFTFFGRELGPPTNHLKVRIATIRDGYADLCREAETIVSERAAALLYEKVLAALPPSFHEELELPRQIGGQLASLRTAYGAAQRDQQVRSVSTELLFQRYSQRAERLPDIGEELCLIQEGRSKSGDRAQGNVEAVTWPEVKHGRAAIQKYRSRKPSRPVTLLRTEGGKRLACQLPKILTEAARNQALGSLIEAYPILGPILDVFRETLDAELEVRVEDAIKRTTEVAVDAPEALDDVLDREVAKIAGSTTIEISEGTMAECQRAGEGMRVELAGVRSARAEVADTVAQVNSVRVDKLIAKLSSSNAEVRSAAAEKLAAMGEKLTESHVRTLIRTMRTGRRTWSSFLYRDGHCNFYEDVSIKHYAATALDTESRFVTQQVREEARRVQETAKSTRRVTDPGWICF